MENDSCAVCSGVLGGLSLYPYYANILGKKTSICKVGGRKCLDCGHIEYDDDPKTLEHINQQTRIKIAETMQDKDAVPILVSHVKQVRLKNKLPQKLVAKALGVTEQRIGAIERNANTPTVLTFFQIAAIMGVGPESLYNLIYINKNNYDKIKDMELIFIDGKPKFKTVEKVKTKREQLHKIRDEIKILNDEKRKYRVSHRKGDISTEKFNEKIKALDEERKALNKIKGSADGKIGLEAEIKKLESKHNLILKQENVIDSEYWEYLKNEFEDELKEIVF